MLWKQAKTVQISHEKSVPFFSKSHQLFAVLRQITCFFFANQKINCIKLTFRDHHHAHRAGLKITMLRNSIFLSSQRLALFRQRNFRIIAQYINGILFETGKCFSAQALLGIASVMRVNLKASCSTVKTPIIEKSFRLRNRWIQRRIFWSV